MKFKSKISAVISQDLAIRVGHQAIKLSLYVIPVEGQKPHYPFKVNFTQFSGRGFNQNNFATEINYYA